MEFYPEIMEREENTSGGISGALFSRRIVFTTVGENEELQTLSCVIKHKILTGDFGGINDT